MTDPSDCLGSDFAYTSIRNGSLLFWDYLSMFSCYFIADSWLDLNYGTWPGFLTSERAFIGVYSWMASLTSDKSFL